MHVANNQFSDKFDYFMRLLGWKIIYVIIKT